MTRLAARRRGPSNRPSLMASRRSDATVDGPPRSRTVVTPARRKRWAFPTAKSTSRASSGTPPNRGPQSLARCTCASIRPGTSVASPRSTSISCAGSAGSTAVMRPSSTITTPSWTGSRSVPATTVPARRTVLPRWTATELGASPKSRTPPRVASIPPRAPASATAPAQLLHQDGQGLIEAVDLLERVVVCQPYAQGRAPCDPLVETECVVVVAAPDPETLLCQGDGQVSRHHLLEPHEERGHPVFHGRRSVEGGTFGQAGQEPLPQRPLPRRHLLNASDPLEVVVGGHQRGEKLVGQGVCQGSGAHRLVGDRACLVRSPRLEQLLAPVCDPKMGPAELVGRAQQYVGVERLHVDGKVGRVLHRVDPEDGPRVADEPGHLGNVHRGPDGVRGEREGDHLGPRPEKALEVSQVEGRVAAHIHLVHDEVTVPRQLQPGRHVGVVVEPRDQDLVPG